MRRGVSAPFDRAWAVASDFPYAILYRVDHRPWPLPEEPWLMTQSWHNLLFAHVYFFSLDAARSLAVAAARCIFHLPYYTAAMTVAVRGDEVRYTSRRMARVHGPAAFEATYRPVGPVQHPRPGTLEHFLTERYCLYTVDRRFHIRRLEIHHPPWPLQAADAEIAVNTMAEAAGIHLPRAAALLHYSQRQDVLVWPLRTVRA